jgi:Tfp pilus assembly protein PilN
VRPVNLIPADQRRGAARPGADTSSPIRAYIVLGALGAALLCVLALVVTNNKINSKKEEVAKISTEAQSAKAQADALRPYGQFADLQQSRQSEINGLVVSRFDWERALRQLSLAIPRNVWLLSTAGTLSPGVEVEGGAGSGDISNMREKVDSPAFVLSGCTYSHHAVARMMVRMQNLDDVTDVQLAKSARKDESEQTGGTAVTAASDQSGQQQQESQDCVGSQRITKFDMLVVFGGSAGSTTAAAAGVPSGAAAPLAQAQAAGAQAQASSSAAQGQAVSATGGGQ